MTYEEERSRKAAEELSLRGQRLARYADHEYEELLTAISDAWRSDDAAAFLQAAAAVKDEMRSISEDVSRMADTLKNMTIRI